MVQRPAPRPAFFRRDGYLPRHQQPPSWRGTVYLVAGEKVRILGEQPLQQLFRVVWLLPHFDQMTILLD